MNLAEINMSKYLKFDKIDSQFVIKNINNGLMIKGSQDLINFFSDIKNEVLTSEYLEENFEFVQPLIDNEFLCYSNANEIDSFFKNMRERFNLKNKTFKYEESGIILNVNYSKDNIRYLPEEVLKILYEIQKEFYQYIYPINISFLESKNYSEIALERGFPISSKGFIDGKFTLILNYEEFFKKENSDLFYPVIRHEGLHILFAQYEVDMPFWIEEGICELFSKRRKTIEINRYLKEINLIDFMKIDYKSTNNIINLELPENQKQSFYLQAQSFVDFFLKNINIFELIEITKNKPLAEDFFLHFKNVKGIPFDYYLNEWKNQIRAHSNLL